MGIIHTECSKRLGIYFFYDRDGIADRYNEYLLRDINQSLSELCVVANGKLDDTAEAMFKKYAAKVIVRNNEGFDVWAYKTVLDSYGWEKLAEFDEVILFNFTIFGPFKPFADVFAEMDRKDLDFWGISKHYSLKDYPFGSEHPEALPTHLQSHFFAIRTSMLKSDAFHDYWDNMRQITSYKDAVCYHEAIFTKTFADAGFRWAAYTDSDDLAEQYVYPLMAVPQEMLRRGCPIMKRKSFFMDYMYYWSVNGYGEATDDALRYIQENTGYDVDMIWENLLRTTAMEELKDCMHLNFAVPECSAGEKRAALVFHVTDLASGSLYGKHLRAIVVASDLVVVSQFEPDMLRECFGDLLEKAVFIGTQEDFKERCREILERNRYECIGILSDALWQHDQENARRTCEAMIDSAAHVNGVVQLFQENRRMGLLTPSDAYNGKHITKVGTAWSACFDEVKRWAADLGITVPFSQKTEPFLFSGDCGWFRSALLTELFDSVKNTAFSDAELRKYLIPLLVQEKGYYCAWGYATSRLSLELTNLHQMNRMMVSNINKNYNAAKGFKVNGLWDMLYYEADALNNLYDLRAYCDHVEKDVSALRKYAKHVEHDMQDLRDYNSALEQDMSALRKYAKHVEHDMQELREYTSAMEQDVSALCDYNAILEKKTTGFFPKVWSALFGCHDKTYSSQLVSLSSPRQIYLEENLGELREYSNGLEAELGELRQYAKHVEKDIQELRTYNSSVEEDVLELCAYSKGLEGELQELRGFSQRQEEEIQILRRYNTALKKSVPDPKDGFIRRVLRKILAWLL